MCYIVGMRLISQVLELNPICQRYWDRSSNQIIGYRQVSRLWAVTREPGMRIQFIMEPSPSDTSYGIQTFLAGARNHIALSPSGTSSWFVINPLSLHVGLGLYEWAWGCWMMGCTHLRLEEWR